MLLIGLMLGNGVIYLVSESTGFGFASFQDF